MSKQKTIRGTKPTLYQRKFLERNQKNPDDFMFVKEIIRHADDQYASRNRKSLNKASEKKRVMVFVKKGTNETIELTVGR